MKKQYAQYTMKVKSGNGSPQKPVYANDVYYPSHFSNYARANNERLSTRP